MEISFQYSSEGFLELLIGKCIAKGVHRTVCVAQEIRKHVEVPVDAWWVRAEAFDQCQDVVRCPTHHEGPKVGLRWRNVNAFNIYTIVN